MFPGVCHYSSRDVQLTCLYYTLYSTIHSVLFTSYSPQYIILQQLLNSLAMMSYSLVQQTAWLKQMHFPPSHVFSPIQPPLIIMFTSSIPHEVNSIQIILYNLHFKVVILSMPMSRYYSITPPTLRFASYVKLSVKVHNFTHYKVAIHTQSPCSRGF